MSAGISPRRRGESASAPCDVPGCGEVAFRSLARGEVRKAFPQVSEEGRRAGLCKPHYKAYKKATRGERELERLDW
jgi:hypothetical protein